MKNNELIELLIETALQNANAPMGNTIEVLSPLKRVGLFGNIQSRYRRGCCF